MSREEWTELVELSGLGEKASAADAIRELMNNAIRELMKKKRKNRRARARRRK